MKVLQIFGFKFYAVLCSGIEESSLKPYLVGGKDAHQGQFPYQVFFRSAFNDRFISGGSILNNRFVLTTATSFSGVLQHPQFVFVVVGITNSNDGVKMATDKIIRHEKFDLDTNLNNICLIKVAGEITFSKTVQPIALPSQETPPNTLSIFSGWGMTKWPTDSSTKLQFVEMRTISQSECLERYERHDYRKYVHETNLCTLNQKGIGTCFDMGGALVDITKPDKKVLIGMAHVPSMPCGIGNPDLFTRVFAFTEWIQTQMKQN